LSSTEPVGIHSYLRKLELKKYKITDSKVNPWNKPMTQRHHAVVNCKRSVIPNWHALECKKRTKISRKSYFFLSLESAPPSGTSSANTALLATSDAASFACTSVQAQYQRQNKDVFFFADFCRMWAVLAPGLICSVKRGW
jgi:hypothetical protein